ncbi:MAG: hypothetical protein QXY88_03425 [Candidatus Bathyarchaeia archaeon]
MRKCARLCVAIGGFLLMTGIILVGITLLVVFQLVDTAIFEYETHIFLLMLTFFLIGILDFIAGVILLRR